MKNSRLLLVLFITLLINLVANSQTLTDSTSLYRIQMKDGNDFTGSVLQMDSINLVLNTDIYGRIIIPRSEIKSKTALSNLKIVNNAVWIPNTQSGRYFWAPNGYGLEKGSSYYQNIWVLYNQVSISASDNFSIGGGVVPLFLFAGAPTPVWLLPKFSIPVVRDKVNIGTGALLGSILGETSVAFGLLYETTTFGSRDKNFSIGFAYGFADDSWMSRPIINFSTMIRTGPKGYFISENYIIPYEIEDWNNTDFVQKHKSAVVFSLGGRTMIRSVGLDYSLWIPVNADMDSFVAIPFLGVTIPIGKNK